MMQVKKYRAATTREALEQIKQDLGEDAFVLETRRVKAGGFLGLGSQMQIEISAANPALNSKTLTEPKAKTNNRKLHLTDNSVAAPVVSEKSNDFEKDKLMSALFSRAEAIEVDEKTKNPLKYGSFLGLDEPAKFETVEISRELPRIVHPKREKPKPVAVEQLAPISAVPTDNISTLISNRELELLRAELREVKFSLGAFSNRQNTQIDQTEVDFEKFGEVFDSPYFSAYLELTHTGVSAELARKMVAEIIPLHKKGIVKSNKIAQKALLRALPSIMRFEESALERNEPSILAVIGSTGVGKTTTVAKLAARVALRERRRVELVTIDTYRIAAVEQLKIYAEIIGANCHVVRSVFELDAVLRRMPSDATVLIDTTGKNPHDLADQYELADYLKGRDDITKCLAVQATTNFSDALAAIKKFEMYGADCLALTKLDETTRPGTMVELVAEGLLPLTYICAGQRVPEDLISATAENFTNRIIQE